MEGDAFQDALAEGVRISIHTLRMEGDAPTKLESYKAHEDPPGISGSLVEGRIVYDAFVLDNKKAALYYQAIT